MQIVLIQSAHLFYANRKFPKDFIVVYLPQLFRGPCLL